MVLCIAFAMPAWAQCRVKTEGLKSGEQAEYELSFNWKFVWLTAGKAALQFDKTTYNDQPAYRLSLLAVGNKTSDAIFKLRDTLTSYVSEYLEPLYYRKGAEEGKSYRVDEAYFSYIDGVSHVKQIRNNKGKVTEYENSDSRCIYDMLSVLAWARVMDTSNLQKGDKIQIPVATGRRVDELALIYEGKGEFKAENKVKYRCLKFSLTGKDKNGKDKNVMVFNITDDKNRLPVRIDLGLNFGAAQASLKKTTGNSYPFTSIVED